MQGLIEGRVMHISAAGQFRHWCYPIAQLLPPLVLKQTALDFG
jgi:hypothetical protein